MRSVFTKNKLLGLIMIALAVIVFVVCGSYPTAKVSGDVGSAVFPEISSGLCAVCGALLMLPSKQNDNEKGSLTKAQWLRVVIMFGLYAAYGAALYVFGYVIATPVLCFVMFFIMSREKKAPIWHGIVYSAAISVAVYLLFFTLFKIRLPMGILF